MKSIKELSWNVTEDEYRGDPAYSYSILSKYDRDGFRKLHLLYSKIESSSLLFGSIVDTILTGGEEEFNKNYIVATFPKIGDVLESITRYLYNNYNTVFDSLDEFPEEILDQAAILNDYYNNDRYRYIRVKKIKENCPIYYNLLVAANGKTVVSTDVIKEATKCAIELRRNEYTKKYFNTPEDPNMELVYQLKFKASYNNINVRCMFDMIYVDHINKIIYPIDLKTSYNNEESFESSFETWGYSIQAQLYSYILKENIIKDDYFKDFTIKNYKFIVINKDNNTPIVWLFPHTFTEIDLVNNSGVVFKNWRTLLKELYYYHHNDCRYPDQSDLIKELKLNGEIKLNTLHIK